MFSRLLARPKGNLPFCRLFFLFFLTAIFLSVQPARAAQVTLAWDPSTDTDLQGYKVYYGTTSGTYQLLADMGMNTYCNVDNLQDGLTYYFAATAYSSSAESDYSNEVTFAAVATHTITTSAGQGGSISPSGAVTVSDGGSQAFTISPNDGYTVSDVFVDGVSQGPVTAYTFSNITTDHTVQVTFAPITYTLTVSTGGTGSGTVTSSPSGSSFPSGTVVTLAASPASGSTFSGWSGACSGTSTTCAVAMTADLSTVASFAASAFTITASANRGGSISPKGTTTVHSGDSQTYSITPAFGYSISDVKVDGVSVGKVTSYTFSNITASHQIQATFSRTGSAAKKK